MPFDPEKFQQTMAKAGIKVRHIPWEETKAKLDAMVFVPRGLNPDGWFVGEEIPRVRFRPMGRLKKR